MKLAACLTPIPQRTLLFLARERGLPLARNLSQRTLSRKLATALLAPAPLTALLATLTPAEMGLLRWLLDEGGSVPLTEAIERYGPIRPYHPWRLKIGRTEPPAFTLQLTGPTVTSCANAPKSSTSLSGR